MRLTFQSTQVEYSERKMVGRQRCYLPHHLRAVAIKLQGFVYRYEVGIPVLKRAGYNVVPTRGMVDLE